MSALAAIVLTLAAPNAAAQCLLSPLDERPPEAGGLFAYDVVTDGDWLFVGDPYAQVPGRSPGAVFVYRRNGATWEPAQTLSAPLQPRVRNFGLDLDLDEGRLAVGAPGRASLETLGGAAFVYTESGGSWNVDATLIPTAITVWAQFGQALSFAGDRLFVGAPSEDDPLALHAGKVFVYRQTPSGWDEEAPLLPTVGLGTGDRSFGHSVTADEGTLVIGAFRSGGSIPVLRVFDLSGGAPAASANLEHPRFLPTIQTFFTTKLAVDGDLIVAGDPSDIFHSVGTTAAGAAWIYRRGSGDWSIRREIRPPLHGDRDRFGDRVELVDGQVLASARDYSTQHFQLGSIFRFANIPGTFNWDNTKRYTLPIEPGPQSNLRFQGVGGGLVLAQTANPSLPGILALDTFRCTGLTVCDAEPNSLGQRAQLLARGQKDVSANDLTLEATGLPPDVFTLFLVGSDAIAPTVINGSAGRFCLGGTLGRIPPIMVSDGVGTARLTLDLESLPLASGAVSVMAGDTWTFQGWYRDTPLSNLTSAFSVQFE